MSKGLVCFDMDGVLVDFVKGAVEQINKDIKNESLTGDDIQILRDKLKEVGKKKIEEAIEPVKQCSLEEQKVKNRILTLSYFVKGERRSFIVFIYYNKLVVSLC